MLSRLFSSLGFVPAASAHPAEKCRNPSESLEDIRSNYRGLFRQFALKAEAEARALTDSAAEKVLVGGGTGFVGTELCKSLKRKGYQVVVVSR